MIIWSLFDGSGLMAQPWAEAGHTCYCFNYDGADHGVYEMRVEHENIVYVNKFITPNSCFSDFPEPDIIFAFPSCTDLAGCGEKHQRQQSAVNTAVATAKVSERLGLVYGVPWMVENPVGKLSTLWRKPDYYFHPFEYGGYMSGEENTFHPRMPARDAYTKKTCQRVTHTRRKHACGLVMVSLCRRKNQYHTSGSFGAGLILAGIHRRQSNCAALLLVDLPAQSLRPIKVDHAPPWRDDIRPLTWK